jgi:hypothetical protein
MRLARLVIAGWAVAACVAAFPLGARTEPPKQEREAAAPASQLSEVGKGARMGRKELQPGAFIGSRHRGRAQEWISRHRAGAAPGPWRIGQSLPKAAGAQPAPADLLGVLPPTPPGMRYVVVGDAVLLLASQSRMVVDAVALSLPSSSPR